MRPKKILKEKHLTTLDDRHILLQKLVVTRLLREFTIPHKRLIVFVAVLEGLPCALGVCARGPGAALIGALGDSFALFVA